jgi:ubiquinone/menaquinone biosynthesis C-methylase UbiE
MSTFVLMRILESAPQRYDLGIRLLTLGRVQRAYDRLASYIDPGQRVLDIGCGTGALALRAARRGASVRAIDVNPQMLEIAVRRARDTGLSDRIELAEMSVAELDAERSESYDVVMSGLCLSELGDDELAYTLKQVTRILRPGGLLLVADEVRPQSLVTRMLHSLVRIPLAILTYVISQRTTRPIAGLHDKLTQAGLSIMSADTSRLGSFIELMAKKPDKATA